MSNDSTASETTPLRRPDSQEIVGHNNRSLLLSTPSPTSTPVRTAATAAHTISVTANALDNIGDSLLDSARTSPAAAYERNTRHRASYKAATVAASSSGDGGGTTSHNSTLNHTVVIAANHCNSAGSSSSSSNNNNNIEVRLGHNWNQNNNNKNTYNPQYKMDTNKRILCRIGLDVLILLCVGFPILFFYLFGEPYKRGFFCDDESLKHPFKSSTIKSWMLYIIGLVIPIGVITAVEIVRAQQQPRTSNRRRYVFMGFSIPYWMEECYKKIGIFGFGVAVSQLTTDIAKYSIGRLRPHFFAVCQPKLNDGTTCADAINVGRYIENFECAGIGSDARMLKEVRLSFPSGHSSFSFFTMVYLALYLQARMTWNGSKLLRHFLQFMFIMVAWYTALSRVSDYKHHWSDVLAGSAIGALCALIVANFLSDLFRDNVKKAYVLPHTTQEAQAAQQQQTITTTNGH